jgi:hypothetical protein
LEAGVFELPLLRNAQKRDKKKSNKTTGDFKKNGGKKSRIFCESRIFCDEPRLSQVGDQSVTA